MLKTIKVTLASEEYEIAPLTLKQSKLWREQLGKPITDVMTILAEADTLEFNSPADLVRLVALAKEYVLDSPDLIWEALCAYSPAINAKRETIEEAAYDVEIMDALAEVLKLAYPFGRLVQMFQKKNG